MDKNSRIISTIEARMTSSRLPGKVLMKAANKPMLQILIERLKKSKLINDLIVATTINKEDDPIANLCENLGINYFRGSELNVLDRVCGAAKKINGEVIVEITGDCPLVDPVLVDSAIEEFLKYYPEHRYISNTGPYISMPWGFDVQVFSAGDLFEINESNPDDLDKEHVSYRFYREESKNKYNPKFIQYTGELNRPELRVTLDYYEDYHLIKSTYESLHPKNPDFTAVDVIRWLDKNPEIRDSAIEIRNKREKK